MWVALGANLFQNKFLAEPSHTDGDDEGAGFVPLFREAGNGNDALMRSDSAAPMGHFHIIDQRVALPGIARPVARQVGRVPKEPIGLFTGCFPSGTRLRFAEVAPQEATNDGSSVDSIDQLDPGLVSLARLANESVSCDEHLVGHRVEVFVFD